MPAIGGEESNRIMRENEMTRVNVLLRRIARTMQLENASLQGNDLTQISAHAHEKIQLIAVLSKLLAQRNETERPFGDGREIQSLARILNENKRLLAIHLEAANNAAEAVSDALRSAQSDGTYSRY